MCGKGVASYDPWWATGRFDSLCEMGHTVSIFATGFGVIEAHEYVSASSHLFFTCPCILYHYIVLSVSEFPQGNSVMFSMEYPAYSASRVARILG